VAEQDPGRVCALARRRARADVFNVDTPCRRLVNGVTGIADNLTRITVVGSSLGESSRLKVTAHSTGTPLTWKQVPAS
jgi:hypothetical protein